MFVGSGKHVGPARMRVAGMENVEEWVGIHGSIASGKSTLMKRIKRYIRAHKMDATDPAHIDPTQPNKVYVLLVKEPVKEWNTPRFRLPKRQQPQQQPAGVVAINQSNDTDIGGGSDTEASQESPPTTQSSSPISTEQEEEEDEKLWSMLGIFCADKVGMGFEFQVYVFNSRLQELMRRLDMVAPSDFPRRIVILSERTMLSDRVFYHTVARLNADSKAPYHEQRLYIYNQFSATICDDVLERERRLVYLPTSPPVCSTRQKERDRDGEHCSEDYLQRLDDEHQRMVQRFSEERGEDAVIRMDRFDACFTVEEVDEEVRVLMERLFPS
jgi:deoxyadenosine/deoxycytidine kinase